jgi:hypothetical protein
VAEVRWQDAPNDPAKIDAWGCGSHVHLIVGVPRSGLGFDVVMSKRETVELCSKLLADIETEDEAVRDNTSELWIA